MNEGILTSEASAPEEAYAQAVQANGLVFVSAPGPYFPQAEEQEVHGSVEERAHLALRALIAVLKAAGTTIENVVKATMYFRNTADYARAITVYEEYFAEHLGPRSPR